ncbi:MAG: hypothetical protein ABI479_09845 [Gallionella sp.]
MGIDLDELLSVVLQNRTRSSMMRRILIISFAIFAGWVSPASAGLFSSTGKVIAIFADELFVGEAEGKLDGSGTIKIRSSTRPGDTCVGQFTSSAKLGGNGSLQCSDSATATIKFKRLTIFRGYGTGISSRGTMSFTYGLNANESKPYLTLPAGTALRLDGKVLMLVEVKKPVPVAIPVKGPI